MNADSDIKIIAEKWFEAFNEQDLEKLLSLYDEDAQHYSPKLKVRHPETNGLIMGKPALKTWWQEAFDSLPSLRYWPFALTANGERVCMEYIRRVENEPDMLVAEVLQVKNGLIVESRVYHG